MKTIFILAAAYALLGLAAGTGRAADSQVAPREGRSVLGSAIINASDIEKTAAYYNLLGFQEYDRRGAKPKRVITFNVRGSIGQFIGGVSIHETPATQRLIPGDAYSRMLIVVKDVRGVCKRLRDAGTPCAGEPRVSVGNANAVIAMATDPDGRLLELVELP